MRENRDRSYFKADGYEEEPVSNYISQEHYEDTFAPDERTPLEFADRHEDDGPNPASVSGQWDVISQEIYVNKGERPV